MPRLSGFLWASPAGVKFTRSELEQLSPATREFPEIRYAGTCFGTHRWERYRLTSLIALAGEDKQLFSQPPFKYNLYVVRGLSKIVLLAEKKEVAERAVSTAINLNIFPNLRKVPINLDAMISRCSEKDCEFLVTSLHGRFSGPSQSLKSMSLYGDDVTQSSIYRANSEFFNFKSCGIGRRLYEDLPRFSSPEEGEIARIGNDGYLSFVTLDNKRAADFISAVNFVINSHWVAPWVPIAEGKL